MKVTNTSLEIDSMDFWNVAGVRDKQNGMLWKIKHPFLIINADFSTSSEIIAI